VVHAQGEHQAASELAQAAHIIAGEPISLQLRYLQTLVEMAGERSSTIIPLLGEGLMVDITGVDFAADGKPVVTLALTDSDGRPLPVEALEGYGFTIAQIVVDEETDLSQYQNLLVHEVEGQPYTVGSENKEPALAIATQAFADSDGEWSDQGDGGYIYLYFCQRPDFGSEIDPDLTTSVGVYLYKDNRAFVTNDVFTFVPSGGEPSVTREVVTTEACFGQPAQLATTIHR